jgi:hypothetical protein
MKTTTNSKGESSWTVCKEEYRGTHVTAFTRRIDSDGIEVVSSFFPRVRGMVEFGQCGTMSVDAARAHLKSLRANGWE